MKRRFKNVCSRMYTHLSKTRPLNEQYMSKFSLEGNYFFLLVHIASIAWDAHEGKIIRHEIIINFL